MALWSTRAKRLVLLRGTAKLEALRAHWRPVFKRRPTGPAARNRNAERPTSPWSQLDGHGVTLEVIKGVMRMACGSAPGPDGLRYRAWRAAGTFAAKTVHELLGDFMTGMPIPPDLAEAMMVFLPKREIAGECAAVGRKASVIRPLALMNTDAKIMQGGV